MKKKKKNSTVLRDHLQDNSAVSCEARKIPKINNNNHRDDHPRRSSDVLQSSFSFTHTHTHTDCECETDSG